MFDPIVLESAFYEFFNGLPNSAPDGVIRIDQKIIDSYEIDLDKERQEIDHENSPYCYFFVIEAIDKITLVNNEFIVWIVPTSNGSENGSTLAMIAKNEEDYPKLELVFSTEDEFNIPGLILVLLEKFLEDIKEHESMISDIGL